jgi:hypothetical protein
MNLLEITKVRLFKNPQNRGSEIDTDEYLDPRPNKVMMLPIDKLTSFEGWDKARKGHTKSQKARDKVEAIKIDIQKEKRIPPIFVRYRNRRFQIIDGHHRVEAYRELGYKKIPAQVVPKRDITLSDYDYRK